MTPPEQSSPAPISLTPEMFASAFPFHFAVDRQLRVVQTGSTFRRICSDLPVGQLATEALRLIRPEIEFTREAVLENRRSFFLLEHLATKLRLRGEFVLHPDSDVLIFLGSPWFTDASEIAGFGLCFDDFAVHDSVVDLLQVFQASKLALGDAKKLAEKLAAQRAELRVANERLREQSEQNRPLALIAARTTNAVVLTDPEGRIAWVNEGFTRLTEYALSEAVGRKPGSFLQGPDTDPATVLRIAEQLRQGQGFSVEIVNYSKSGRKYWLAIEVQPIRDEAGRIINFMAIESDITERKDRERELRATLSELERFNRVMIDREERILELKHEMNELCRATGRPIPYPAAFVPAGPPRL